MDDDATLTSTEKRVITRRCNNLSHKLGLSGSRQYDGMTAVERLIKAASYDCRVPYAERRAAVAAWDALPDDERARLLEKGYERRYGPRAQRGSVPRVDDDALLHDLLHSPILLDPFGLKRAARRDAQHGEGHSERFVQVMDAYRQQHLRKRPAYLRVVK